MVLPIEFSEEHLPRAVTIDEHRERAFSQLYDRYWERLVVLCRAMLAHRPDDAEAVAQEAFLRAWASIGSFSGDRPFWPWVSTIARRLCVDYLRQDGRDTRITRKTRHQRRIPPVRPDEWVGEFEDRRTAMAAFISLSPHERRLIQLRDLEGWSYDDIAAFEQVSKESVRSSLKRARTSLRAAFERLSGGLAVLPGAAWVRRSIERVAPWAGRLSEVRPPTWAAGAVAVQALLAVLVGVGMPSTPSSPSRTHSAAVPAPAFAPSAGAGMHVPSASSHGPNAGPRTGWAGPRPPTPLSPLARTLGGGETAAGDDHYSYVATAPNGEVYAVGRPRQGGLLEHLLVRSDDGGRTWAHLPAMGFLGGKLLFPPRYPADDRIFASSQNTGLQVSTDGGESFTPLATVPGYAAMSPSFSDGHPVFLTGDAPGWFVDAERRVAVPTGLTLPAATWRTNFVFSPAYDTDRTVYVGSHAFVPTRVDDVADYAPTVYACRRSQCVEVARAGSLAGGAPELALSPFDGTVWAWSNQAFWRSRDGVTFQALVPPATGFLSVVLPTEGATYVSVTAAGYGFTGGLFRTGDGGASWEKLGGEALPHGLMSLTVAPDGALIGATPGVDRRGLVRSDDGGATWQETL